MKFIKFDGINISAIELEQRKLIEAYPDLIPETFKYTQYYQQINKNHHFEYNKAYLYKLQEKLNHDLQIVQKVPTYEYEDTFEIKNIERGITYDFLSPTGKIMGKGFYVTKIDRKKHMGLFKVDKNEEYNWVDVSSFEPICINYYISGFIHDNFYEENAPKFNFNRDEFKVSFVAWINGAGISYLGENAQRFKEAFKEIEGLRSRMSSTKFINCFGHTLSCSTSYKRLGYLIQSTSADVIKLLHSKIYESQDKSFQIIWSLFDEFLIKGNVTNFVKIFRDNFPIFKLKVIKV